MVFSSVLDAIFCGEILDPDLKRNGASLKRNSEVVCMVARESMKSVKGRFDDSGFRMRIVMMYS